MVTNVAIQTNVKCFLGTVKPLCSCRLSQRQRNPFGGPKAAGNIINFCSMLFLCRQLRFESLQLESATLNGKQSRFPESDVDAFDKESDEELD